MSFVSRSFKIAGLAICISAALVLGVNAAKAAEKVRIALGDVVSVETLAFLVALERAKDRGVDYELTSFAKEELAIQAIVNGQADVGVGTPYSVIQKSKLPLRILVQVSRLVFFPVVSAEYQSWKDLDGQPFTFHARGSGTEAIGNILAKRNGITFGERSYVPGSDNRIIAMMNGQIKATIVDLANKNKLMEMAGDKFRVLPSVDNPSSDEVVFASQEWIQNNPEQVKVITEELLKLWREMAKNPQIIEDERAKRNLLADQPKEVLEEVVPYYTEGVKEGLFDPEGGSEGAVKSDFEFYAEAGQLEGNPADFKVEDFWDLTPLENARKTLGG
ncbi:MAG TPA: ABC transporter substrate-binding protein [Aestuariivirgaceae bacterium]